MRVQELCKSALAFGREEVELIFPSLFIVCVHKSHGVFINLFNVVPCACPGSRAPLAAVDSEPRGEAAGLRLYLL